MGVPFERRGARFDDYVVAMRKAWKGDVVEHDAHLREPLRQSRNLGEARRILLA